MRKSLKLLVLISVAFFVACTSVDKSCQSAQSCKKQKYDVAAIVWPAYQNEPRWKELGIFSHGCGEWQNVYEGKPRFKGHYQPMVPLWGYERDDDPIAMSRQIDAALASGINVFIYDWYWYQGQPFLENALNNGFLKAPNNKRMKFYLMWANHNVGNLWNNKIADKKMKKPHWSGAVSFEEFTNVLVPRFIEYFKKPNYYKIDGKPVFMLYTPKVFIDGVGGIKKAQEAFAYFDKAVKNAGFAGVHIQFNHVGGEFAPAMSPSNEKMEWKDFYSYLNVESVTSYNWNPLADFRGARKGEKNIDYELYGDKAVACFDKIRDEIGVQYFPNVTIGWDNNARFPESVSTKITLNKSPEVYEKFLRFCKNWIDKNSNGGAKLIVINAWNEWTEGGYLQPCTKFGYGYLNATARVFTE